MAGVLETLLHFEGANGSTTFTDVTGKHPWSSGGGAPVIDTSQFKFGSSSLHLTSVNDYIRIPDASFALNTVDFTIDFWVRFNGAQANLGLFDLKSSDWILNVPPGGGLQWYSFSDGGQAIVGATVVTANVWHHVAFTRQGSNHYLFLDGIQQGSTLVTTRSYTGTSGFPTISQGFNGASIVGWVDEFRIVTGNADWTANFTPPTAPYLPSDPTPVLETLLHFEGTNGSQTFTDSTGKHSWVSYALAAGPAVDTSQAKFGSSALTMPAVSNISVICTNVLTWGTGPFTIDFWVKLNGTQPGQQNLFDISNPGGIIYIPNAGGPLYFYVSAVQIQGTTAVTTDVWHHIALTFDGAKTYLFLDGHLEGTPWANAAPNYSSPTNYPQIRQAGGTCPIGWYDEVRIQLGRCDWTASFTPPTAPYADPIGVYTLTAATGSFALTGIAAGTLYGYVLSQTTVGNFTLTGIAAGSISSYVMPLVPGSFVFTGIAAGTLVGHALSSALGAFAFTGITANLIYSAGLNSYVMSATPGAFVFTGIAANLVYYQLVNYVLVCGTGQFYFTGLGVGSPGQGLLSGSGLGTPVVTIPFGGAPVIDVTYLGLKAGAPVSEAAPGEGTPVTKVTTGGTPVVYI